MKVYLITESVDGDIRNEIFSSREKAIEHAMDIAAYAGYEPVDGFDRMEDPDCEFNYIEVTEYEVL